MACSTPCLFYDSKIDFLCRRVHLVYGVRNDCEYNLKEECHRRGAVEIASCGGIEAVEVVVACWGSFSWRAQARVGILVHSSVLLLSLLYTLLSRRVELTCFELLLGLECFRRLFELLVDKLK